MRKLLLLLLCPLAALAANAPTIRVLYPNAVPIGTSIEFFVAADGLMPGVAVFFNGNNRSTFGDATLYHGPNGTFQCAGVLQASDTAAESDNLVTIQNPATGSPLSAPAHFYVLAAPSASLSAGAAARGQDALARVNLYRQTVGLPPVTLDMGASASAAAHTYYLYLNPDLVGLAKHTEDPSRPGYTPTGAGVYGEDLCDTVGADGVTELEILYYHRSPILSPSLTAIGYADCVASPTAADGSTFNVSLRFVNGPAVQAAPILTPGPGSLGNALAPSGETPSPTPTFGSSNGIPIIAYFGGSKADPTVSVAWVSSTVTAGGQTLPHVVIAPNMPSNAAFEGNEICLITNAPLPASSTIAVNIQYMQAGQLQTVNWSFNTSADVFTDIAAMAAGPQVPSPIISGSGTGGTGGTGTVITQGPPVLVPILTSNGNVGRPFSYSVPVFGTQPITLAIDSTTPLPIGLFFDGASTISGVPFVPGIFEVNINATNSAGAGTQRLTFNIGSPPENKSSGSVKYSDSLKQSVFSLGSGGGFDIATTTNVSISLTANLSAAELMSITDTSECYFEVGDFVFDQFLSDADKIQSGKKYTFNQTADFTDSNGNAKTAKIGTTTIAIAKNKLTIKITGKASNQVTNVAAVAAFLFQNQNKKSVTVSVPMTLELGSVELDFYLPATGSASVKAVSKKSTGDKFNVSSVSTKGSGSK